MKILALEKEVGSPAPGRFEPFLAGEAKRAWELYQDGFIREIYFRGDRSEAVLVLECVDVDAAREKLATLPLVKEGLIEFELITLRPYPGFARLFATEYTGE